MLARTDTVATIAESWLAQLEAALAGPGRSRLKELFHPDSHWRDVLAKSARRFAEDYAETSAAADMPNLYEHGRSNGRNT